jgi:hypothetical protein
MFDWTSGLEKVDRRHFADQQTADEEKNPGQKPS